MIKVCAEKELAHPDDGVHRRAQLVAHRGQERALRLRRRLGHLLLVLELATLLVQLLERRPKLIVHQVHVHGQIADLVAVVDLDVIREVAGGDLGEPRADSLDWTGHRR